MPTDAEVRDKKLTELRGRLQELREQAEQVKAELRMARLEDDAQARLTTEQRDVLAAAGFTDQTDTVELTARRDALQAQIDALQAFIDAVRTVA